MTQRISIHLVGLLAVTAACMGQISRVDAFPVLTEVSIEPGWISVSTRLIWFSADGEPALATLERTGPNDTNWQSLGTLFSSGGFFGVQDGPYEVIGARYGYRLAWTEGDRIRHSAETWVDIPGAYLGIIGFRENPLSRTGPTVWFNLESTALATLEMFDVSGRLVASSGEFSFSPGRRAFTVSAIGPLYSGVYVIRLRQGGKTVTKKAALLHWR